MKSTIKLISGAAILLASLSGRPSPRNHHVGSPANISFTFVKAGQVAGASRVTWNQIGERTGYKVERL